MREPDSPYGNKNLKMHQFAITGVDMEPDGISLDQLEDELGKRDYDLAYLVPSYHNPTGIVMSHVKRAETIRLLNERQIPIIEDGFNEEAALFWCSCRSAYRLWRQSK